jgi:DUF4097 and DUF4098 domain-containing protein YvlB
MKIRALIAVLVLSAAAEGAQPQAVVRRTVRSQQKFTLAQGGTFVLENMAGNIEIVAADVTDVEADITTLLTAADADTLEFARRHSDLMVGGDTHNRLVRTSIGNEKTAWSAVVHWTIRVPRISNVKVISTASQRVRVAGIGGTVYVRNFNGNVDLENIGGAAVVESVNGSIIYTAVRPRANVRLSTINGHVTATVAGDADFAWVAETAGGDIRTNLPARGAFLGVTFHGNVNAPGGPTITTQSLMGNIHLLASGAASRPTQSLIKAPDVVMRTAAGVPQMSSASGGLNLGKVKAVNYSTKNGDVTVREVLGDANVSTGAGHVLLGSVSGACTVRSLGGPLELGEVLGLLTASTRAGDILIDSTRRGGTISTEGGTIRLLYTSGPTRLTSGGGDIIVRQAAGPVTAETSSGDITITIDPISKTQQVDARTSKGNVILNVNGLFRATVDATIYTTDPKADTIVSDIPGLSISREQVGGRTKVHATGKINGGGQKVVLQATDGDIRISMATLSPTIVKAR